MFDFHALASAYPYRTDLHVHTFPVSSCAYAPAAEATRLYRDAGCDAIVITNHLSPAKWTSGNPLELAELYLSDYEAAKKAAGEDLTVILGVEIRFPENANDYLIYGVSPEDIEHFITLLPHGIENFYKKAKTERNVILQAHPFRKEMVRAPLNAIDGIEVFNMHQRHNSAVAVAAQFARENDLLICGGSDFHRSEDTALCLVRTQDKLRDSYDVAELIQSKNFLFDLSGNLILPYQN